MGIIAVTNLGKAYKSYPNKWSRVLEWFGSKSKSRHSLKWILKDVTFAIAPGEAVGIIGLNGAGKSSLLKLIVGTIAPSEGEIYTSGSIVALLELGMGFHPEFTGRQNVYMAAQLQGLSAAKVDSLMPEIEAFSEIGEYIDRPLREYSSGMQMRLAFAVATCKRPDVLIVDEALSVGDAYFQHKCTDRIKSFQELGTTFLLVSHSPAAIKAMCQRAMILSHGKLVKDGAVNEVMDYYNAIISTAGIEDSIRQVEDVYGQVKTRSGNLASEILSVELESTEGSVRVIQSGSLAILKIRFRVNIDLNGLTIGVMIKDKFGIEVFGTNTFHHKVKFTNFVKKGVYAIDFNFPNFYLGVGNYSVTAALHSGSTHLEQNYDWLDRALVFDVISSGGFLSSGICNLPVNVSEFMLVENNFERIS